MMLPEHIRQVFSRATCLYTKEEVEAAIDRIASEISDVLMDSNPIFLCVVVGGIVLMGHLLLRLDFPLELDYVHATRYQGALQGKDIEWRVKPKASIRGRTIVIVDDILDGGLTLNAIIEYCAAQGAAHIYSAVLVDKCHARLLGGKERADFSGLEVDNDYVFGYGMDYKNYLRNAPGIYKVALEDM